MVKCYRGDTGFPVGSADPLGGGGMHRPPMLALFSENKCENERIGSHRVGVGWGVVCGACQQHPMDPPMNDITKLPGSLCCLHDSFVTSSL